MPDRNLSEVLEEIYYEYDLGYESVHGEAVKRVCEIITEHELDEVWNLEIADKRVEQLEIEINRRKTNGEKTRTVA